MILRFEVCLYNVSRICNIACEAHLTYQRFLSTFQRTLPLGEFGLFLYVCLSCGVPQVARIICIQISHHRYGFDITIQGRELCLSKWTDFVRKYISLGKVALPNVGPESCSKRSGGPTSLRQDVLEPSSRFARHRVRA